MSPELSDQILQHLRLTLLDLIERERMEAHLSFVHDRGYVYVPVLHGRIGPGCPWPTELSSTDRLPFPASHVSSIAKPVAARLAADPRMVEAFTAGDVVLLDQSVHARTVLEDSALYVVKSATGGIVRRLKLRERSAYVLAEDVRRQPLSWQKIDVDSRQVTRLIRARVHLVNPGAEWC